MEVFPLEIQKSGAQRSVLMMLHVYASYSFDPQLHLELMYEVYRLTKRVVSHSFLTQVVFAPHLSPPPSTGSE